MHTFYAYLSIQGTKDDSALAARRLPSRSPIRWSLSYRGAQWRNNWLRTCYCCNTRCRSCRLAMLDENDCPGVKKCEQQQVAHPKSSIRSSCTATHTAKCSPHTAKCSPHTPDMPTLFAYFPRTQLGLKIILPEKGKYVSYVIFGLFSRHAVRCHGYLEERSSGQPGE